MSRSVTRPTCLVGLTTSLLVLLGGCAKARTEPTPAPIASTQSASSRPAIVPMPRRLVAGSGEFQLDRATRIVVADGANAELRTVAELLALPLRAASGLPLPIESANREATNAIVFRLDASMPSAEPEAYRLDVTTRGATLAAPTPAGLINGVATIRQLLPPAYEHGVRTVGEWVPDSARTTPTTASASTRWSMPAVEIEDAPRFRYRGILLDLGRYYLPPEFIAEVVDLIALYKFNVLQLHLTDDQGWRLEIRKYPRLTSVGAWRKESMLAQNFDPYIGDKKPHGGFYTQAQVRQLVAYAAARGVTIVPEIEMPGHTGAAIAAYPELACTAGPFEVSTTWGVHEEIICPSERSITFMQDVLTEVMELFPSTYIHTGGDEAPKARWKASPVAQKIIRREGLKDEEALQGWFTKRMEQFLRAHGRKLLGWDEILEGGIDPQAAVMSWRGMQGGITAARLGHDVVMSPGDYAYLDHYQGDPATEPLAICCYLPLDTVYAFEPVPPELTPAQATHIIGVQGNLWGEYIATPRYAEYMLLPRMLALAEVAWSPKEARNFDAFLARLPAQVARLDALGVDYRLPEPQGPWGDHKVLEERAEVAITSPFSDGVIRYTTDGTEPTASSARYERPVSVAVGSTPAIVKARLYLPNGRASAVATARYARATWVPAVTVGAAALQPGLTYVYSEGTFKAADDVRPAAATRTGTATKFAFRGDERAEQYGLRFTGLLRVPEDALYTFYVIADDGVKLRIDGDLVVDHDGQHDATEKRGEVALRAGLHRVELLYFQGPGGAVLRLDVSAKGMARREVPAEWLVHERGDAR